MPRRHMRSGVLSPPFLTSALDGGDLSALGPGHFVFEYEAEWAARGGKKTLPLPGIEPLPSRPYPVAILTEISGQYVKGRYA
jgi:hypothetical protein